MPITKSELDSLSDEEKTVLLVVLISEFSDEKLKECIKLLKSILEARKL